MTTKLQTYTTVTAEVITAIAVLVTLAAIVIEIKENTSTLRATSAAASRDSLASMNDLLLTLDDDYWLLLIRSRDHSVKLEDFSKLEQMKLIAIQRSFFRRAEAQYFRYRSNLLDEDTWQTVRRRVTANSKWSVWQEMWKADRDHIYTAGFIEEIESYQSTENLDD